MIITETLFFHKKIEFPYSTKGCVRRGHWETRPETQFNIEVLRRELSACETCKAGGHSEDTQRSWDKKSFGKKITTASNTSLIFLKIKLGLSHISTFLM